MILNISGNIYTNNFYKMEIMKNLLKISYILNCCRKIKHFICGILDICLAPFYFAVYEKKIRQLRSKEKIKICFLVNSYSKWCVQALFDELKKNSRFEVVILVTLADIQLWMGADEKRDELLHNLEFFRKYVDPQALPVYDVNTCQFLPLDSFLPDIVVYQQPWDIVSCQNVKVTGKYALTMYFPYGFLLIKTNQHYRKQWHAFMWKYFLDLPENVKRLEQQTSAAKRNCVFYGYPKVCTPYKDQKNLQRPLIVYTPHWSIGEFSTFYWSYKKIIETAEKYPQFDWVFRPHPTLKSTLEDDNHFLHEEIEDFYNFWEKRAISGTTEIEKYFYNSTMMITDSISYLGEYLMTAKPVIHLCNPESHSLLNPAGQKIAACYYSVYSEEDFEKVFVDLMFEHKDDLRIDREKYAKTFASHHQNAPQRIINYLEQELF